jgi:ASC-1-like (ASCH) protein
MGRKRIEARIKKEAVEAVKSGKLTQSEASQQLNTAVTAARAMHLIRSMWQKTS